ncbi:MAG: hypothetical protein Kow00108_08110 [Calditrichia bacterium]
MNRYFIFLFAIIMLLAGCAGNKPVVKESPATDRATLDETFDPMSIPDDANIVIPEKPVKNGGNNYLIEPEQPKPQMVDTLALLEKKIPGYRVQIFATRDREQAYLLKDEATKIFSNDSINVYIEFNQPYYKIRIGDCKTREDANRLQRKAINRGYTNAWVVKSSVLEFPELMWKKQ